MKWLCRFSIVMQLIILFTRCKYPVCLFFSFYTLPIFYFYFYRLVSYFKCVPVIYDMLWFERDATLLLFD